VPIVDLSVRTQASISTPKQELYLKVQKYPYENDFML
jgi:hypothetical protein